jgi:uncharacterized Zn finger protein
MNSNDPARPPQNKRYAERKPDGPRRVRHGMKLQGTLDFGVEGGRNWGEGGSIGQRIFSLTSRLFDEAALGAGFEYAKSGQAINLELQTGSIRSSVQGTAARPYQVQLKLPAFDQAQWQSIIEAMSGEAMYSAKMLTGEWPPGIDEMLGSLGLHLLPPDASELQFSCTCAAPQPCKHAATVIMLTADRLHAHPLLVFTLLGMPAEQLLERLRRARTIQAKGSASAHGDAQIPETQIEPPPLEACIDAFWHGGRDLSELADLAPPAHAPHALLRRLGPSPLKGKFPMVGLLASVYDSVAQAARKLADEPLAEREDGKADQGG